MGIPENSPLGRAILAASGPAPRPAPARSRRTRGPKGESEAAFARRVMALARARGWRCAHFRAVRVQRANGSVYHETPVAGDGAGFPDLVLVKAGRVVVAELKVPGGRVRPEQRAWLGAFLTAGVPAVVWRPADWPEIDRVLC